MKLNREGEKMKRNLMGELTEGIDVLAERRKMRDYPEDYKGPKAGQSSNEEWAEVRDYNAFKYIRDGAWSYSDFDCYLYSMCEARYIKGRESVLNALTEMQKITGIRS